MYSWPLLIPWRRATVIGDTPGSRHSAAISRFCSTEQRRRRRSPRVITLIRRLPALLRLLGEALLAFDPPSLGSSPIAMGNTHQTFSASGNVRLPLRLPKIQCSRGHICGEVTSDIDSDQAIVALPGGELPFKMIA